MLFLATIFSTKLPSLAALRNGLIVTALVENGGSWQMWIMVDASYMT